MKKMFKSLIAKLSKASQKRIKTKAAKIREEIEQLKTCEGVIKAVLNHLGPEDIQILQGIDNKKDLIRFHFTTGRQIRNNFNLWTDTDLLKSCSVAMYGEKSNRSAHPDDASQFIIEQVWETIKNAK